MVSVMVTFGTVSVLKFPWLIALPGFFLLPNGVLLAVLFFLVMGRPPRYLRDWFESRVLGRTEVEALNLPEIEQPETEA